MSRVRCAALMAALSVGCSVPFGVGATAQDTRAIPTPEAIVEKLFGSSPVARNQAVAWASAQPEAVVPLIVEALRTRPARQFAFDGVRALGGLRDQRITASMITAFGRRDFLWKPQLIEALADQAATSAEAVFLEGLNSPVARARAAACRGLRAIQPTPRLDPTVRARLRARLDDSEAEVRLEAARALRDTEEDDHTGELVVARDLTLRRTFFDADPGAGARERAAAWLTGITQIDLSPATRAEGASADLLAAVILKLRASRPGTDAVAARSVPPHDPDATGLGFAVEVRSCVEGDLFLRFDEDGRVVFGRDRLVRGAVSPALTRAAAAALRALDFGKSGRRILGPVTCDFERVGVQTPAGWHTVIFGTAKRPAAHDALEADVAAIIRAAMGPIEADRARRRVEPFRAP